MKYQLLRPLNKEEYEALKNNISENGVLTPVVYDEDGNILDGHHRVKACKELGIDDWPSIIRTGLTEAEKKAQVLVLNEARRHLTEADKKELRESRIEIEKELREQGYSYRRIADAVGVDHAQVIRDLKNSGGEQSPPETITGADGKKYPAQKEVAQPSASDKKSLFLHSQKDKDKAKKVWEAAKSGDEDAEKEVKKIDKGESSIHRGYKKIQQKEKERERSKKLKERELPDDIFQVIYCDPPWQYSNSGFEMSAEKQYPTMSTKKIKGMKVEELADSNSVIFMWATNAMLQDAFVVMSAWGFDYKTNFVWVKEKHTAGFYNFGKHELLLIGVKGSMLPTGEKFKSEIRGRNDVHSKKPERVYEIIEQMYPGLKKVELFARNEREGWAAWGNEI